MRLAKPGMPGGKTGCGVPNDVHRYKVGPFRAEGQREPAAERNSNQRNFARQGMRRSLSGLNGSTQIATQHFCDLPAIANVDIVTQRGDGLRKGLVVLGAHDSGDQDNHVTLALRRNNLLLSRERMG